MARWLGNVWRLGSKSVLAALSLLGAFVLTRLGLSALDNQPLPTRLTRDWQLISGEAAREQKIRLTLVGEGFDEVTDIQFVPGASAPRLAVVLQKRGEARLWQPSGAAPTRPGAELFQVEVLTESELGLLGLAFHPDFSSNGLFYINSNPAQGKRRTRIAEWKVQTPSSPGGAAERRVLLEVAQPYSNHNAGALAFGPDRMLYIPLGDGGSANDPQGHGQNPKSWLGKILRIDPKPTATQPYSVPQGNLQPPQFLPEIWALGVRNPWRISFAPNGDLIAADVGQDSYEEIDLIRAGDNQGWNVREAGHCFAPKQGCATQGFVDPIFEYGRAQGTSITGGYVYRGNALPHLKGKYVFADFGSGRIWALPLPERRGGAYPIAEPLGQWNARFSTFGQDADGELYITDFDRGEIFRLAPR